MQSTIQSRLKIDADDIVFINTLINQKFLNLRKQYSFTASAYACQHLDNVNRLPTSKVVQFRANSTGILPPCIEGLDVEMVVDADDAPQKVAQVLKEQWETTLPGFTVTLVIEPKKQRVEDMQEGDFDLGLTRWGPDYADPMTYLGMWITDNSNNYGLWSSEDYDAIIAECTTGDLCTDAEGRWARLYDAEQIVMDEAVIFPLYTQANAEMLSSAVTGIEFHPVALNRVYKNAVKAE